MKFADGFQESTRTEKLVAFWTHMIDRLALSMEILPAEEDLERSHTMYVPYNVMTKTGSPTQEHYLGAVRGGFHLMIQSLPSNVRPVIENYIQERLIKTRNQIPDDVMDSDVVFGTDDPFELNEISIES